VLDGELTGSRQVGPVLHDSDGKLDLVGFTSTIANKDRGELTARRRSFDFPA
jgi:hypothetical protein